jgi:hypothetical protein
LDETKWNPGCTASEISLTLFDPVCAACTVTDYFASFPAPNRRTIYFGAVPCSEQVGRTWKFNQGKCHSSLKEKSDPIHFTADTPERRQPQQVQ